MMKLNKFREKMKSRKYFMVKRLVVEIKPRLYETVLDAKKDRLDDKHETSFIRPEMQRQEMRMQMHNFKGW